MDYKEKLRLAKEALNSGSYDKETIEYIFPELKESEDERIRKELIQYLKDYPNLPNENYSRSDFSAWLEKQGHEGKKWIYEDVYTKEKEQVFQDGVDEVLENPQKYGLKKQAEQKPTWSEEDENMLNDIIVGLTSIEQLIFTHDVQGKTQIQD